MCSNTHQEEYIRPATLFVGQQIIELDSTESTNNYTTEYMRHSVMQEGTVVVGWNQTQGKGQRGNTWQSMPGQNLCFSLVLKPDFLNLTDQFQLSKVSSLAVADYLTSIGIKNVKVKWPNDVLVEKQKIAGILIENSVRDAQLVNGVAGIGLNVNQLEFERYSPEAVSIKLLQNHDYNLYEVLAHICEFFEARYLQLKRGDDQLNQDYLKSLFGYQEWKEYKTTEAIFEGKIVGVAQIGLLQLELRNGELQEYNFKEIRAMI